MKTIAMLLAGGEGSRLTVLSEKRAKPAVPFGGKYRIIDFTLSNCVNSGIYTVGVLTQYRPHSLNEHIGIGKPWNLDRSRGGVRLLAPYQERGGQRWYGGTADAIYQNWGFIEDQAADAVLILSGDHIYKMDYAKMIDYHVQRKADFTVAVMPVPLEETDRFGIMTIDDQSNIVEFTEKPKKRDKGNLASLGIYIFSRRVLQERLEVERQKNPDLDFGKHVIPALISGGYRCVAYRYESYWVDVGTLDSYWATSLELTRPSPALDLFTDHWPVLTRSEERPAARLGPQAKVQSSLISNGCVIRGLVHNSVLSPGVQVSPGAVVENCVIMNDCWIGPGARLDRVIVDKQVVVGAGVTIGPGDDSVQNKLLTDKMTTGLTVIGKGAVIPVGCRLGRNVLINSDREEHHFPKSNVVEDGETV
ncbi:MAG: glucose-1-phosphate adenylyltransferase [Candidatus Eremiobacteraeota bacterium]|nr:glucose-1-phosphate adenylyltransferase [Candidatus Eremiobacteraeota bacterium]MCW5872970.1 glucose-1-phosphate adenylyltransferase [Candidatus Eremiobacteraeota bacterium]